MISAVAGLVAGFFVLGTAGRILMRLLAFTTPEDPRFTLLGTLQIIGLGAVWGMVTGPLVLLARARLDNECVTGSVFGLVVFVLAAVPFAFFSGFTGRIVAPPLFLWLGAITFPLLFVLHGVTVNSLVSRSRDRRACALEELESNTAAESLHDRID